MKRHIILLIFTIFLSISLYSQVKPFRFGVKVSPDFAWMTSDSRDYENDGSAVGFSWGFLADITLMENYFLRTGFSLDYLNAKLAYPSQIQSDEVIGTYVNGTLDRKYNLRYLEIPVVLKMRTNPFGKTALFGEIGFGSSFNLKARGKDVFHPDTGAADVETENDIKDEINLFKGALIVGGGVEYFIDESTSLIGSVTFNNGLTSILKGYNEVDPSVKQKANLYYFQLNIGVMF